MFFGGDIERKYSVFLRDGYEGSDTHGLLVVTRECAAELEIQFKNWLEKNFVPLTMGADNFSGVIIPYYGNENNNPNLREELEELKTREA